MPTRRPSYRCAAATPTVAPPRCLPPATRPCALAADPDCILQRRVLGDLGYPKAAWTAASPVCIRLKVTPRAWHPTQPSAHAHCP